MRTIQAHALALPRNYEREPSQVSAKIATFFSAIAEGVTKAQQYEGLAGMSDRELADLGLKRQDLPHFVMFGKSYVP